MLTLTNINKTFNAATPDERKALVDINLSAEKGDFITILGGNGAGKSTLLNSISGVFIADSGKIELDGENISFMPDYKRASRIGRLFQDPLKGTAPQMTIEENMALAYLRAKGIGAFKATSKADREFFKAKLAELDLGLENRLKTPVGLLSGGQRQALTLLMATLVPPKLLLLDEHTAALDIATAEKVMNLTRQIVEAYGITCLMITHNLQQALSVGNKTIVMNNGKILLQLDQAQRQTLTVPDLIELFKTKAGEDLGDRALFS